jgi:DNA helicase-4
MTILIVLVIAFFLFLAFLRIKHRKKLEKELDEKIQDLQKQVSEFASEFKNLPTHYVDKEEENAFLVKWQSLYTDVSRYCHLKKLNDNIDSRKFLTDFRNIHRLISASNAEIRRLESIKKLFPYVKSFFEEISELVKQYVPAPEEESFIQKWQSISKEIINVEVHSNEEEYELFNRFKVFYGSIRDYIQKSNAEIKRRESIQKQLPQVLAFFEELTELNKQYISHFDEIRFSQKWETISKDVAKVDVRSSDDEYEKFTSLKRIWNSFHDYVQKSNATFIQNEFERCDKLLSDIDGKSLDTQQRTAVINDEDRILVLAGAGSGKTLTIAAKVKYLCEEKSISPNEILLISFTKKSAQEMTDRIRDKLGIEIEAKTFHKLGLDIISHADGARPEVSDESGLNTFIHDFFEKELINYPDLIRTLTEYFAYYLEIPEDIENYNSLGELYQEEKNADLETIKSKYEQEKYIRETGADKAKALTTLNNERVKSLEETKIANFLFLNGIKYEYERAYPFETGDPQRKTYRPDFYLSDYNIYLEHFGVNKDMSAPWLSFIEEEKYIEGMRWKRELHEKNGTKLIETYSYYNSEGILLKKLREILIAHNVEFKPRDFTDIFNTVYKSKSNKYLAEFIKLCCTFITLFKSNNYRIDDVEVLRQNFAQNERNSFLLERTNLFLDIIKVLLTGYQAHLLSKNSIDFSDMINNAADRVQAGCRIPNYRYIIVDEYQDISKSRFNLLKSVAERTGAKLFCVGDDWQSIYRFAGSDISLFTDFEKYFGYTEVLRIEKTYRNSQQLINEASRFVLMNPLQLKKELKSDKSLDYPLVFWGYEKDPSQALNKAIKKIVSEFGTDASILLLGRTNYDKEILEDSGLFRISHKNKTEKLTYIPLPELNIEFLSVHKSKGLEGDNVIILNFKNDKLGFPNQIEDDKILNLVLTNAEDYKFAEERRLFYVAITRTRNRTFILTDNNSPSLFFKEFSESLSVCYAAIKKNSESQSLCPRCKTGILLKVNHEGSSFVGCSNFPRCRFTLRDQSVLLNPKRCPRCGGFQIKRKSASGYWFIGCTNYPLCEFTERLTSVIPYYG